MCCLPSTSPLPPPPEEKSGDPGADARTSSGLERGSSADEAVAVAALAKAASGPPASDSSEGTGRLRSAAQWVT